MCPSERNELPSSLSYKAHFNRQLNCWSLRCSWSIACRRCSNYIFILYPTLGFNILRKDNCKPSRETFKFRDLVRHILEISEAKGPYFGSVDFDISLRKRHCYSGFMVNNIGSRWYENTYVPWHRFHFVLFHIDYIQPVYQPKLYDTANDTAKPESPTPTPYFPPEMRGSTCDNFIIE